MLHKTIELSDKFPGASLTTYVSDDPPELKMSPRRAAVVCPGGGYRFLSEREAEPVVKVFIAAGFNVFLLRYTVGPGAANYAPLIEASLAIKHIREHASEYNIDPAYVFICG
ncbi:MAG TPA: alpha/beta hydrolase, partial [Bacillota bacterium]|nr:alpha/beta hydrolase [Bacillota bacterium]